MTGITAVVVIVSKPSQLKMLADNFHQFAQSLSIIIALADSRSFKLGFRFDDEMIFITINDFPFGQHAQFKKFGKFLSRAALTSKLFTRVAA